MITRLWCVAMAVVLVGVCAASLTWPCAVSSPVVSIDNWIFLLLLLISLPPMAFLLSSRAQLLWRPRLSLGLLAISIGAVVILMTDLGILLLGKRIWMELVELEDEPGQRVCYAEVVVSSTDYGHNAFETGVEKWIDIEKRHDALVAASKATKNLAWREKFDLAAKEAATSK